MWTHPTNSNLQAEAIPESLKNIMLVMADGGYLVPPSQDASKEPIWSETKKRLERFLPDLFLEIFPDAANEKSAPVSVISSPKRTSAEVPVDDDTKPQEEQPAETETEPATEKPTTPDAW